MGAARVPTELRSRWGAAKGDVRGALLGDPGLDALPRVTQHPKLLVAQALEKSRPHAREMGRTRLGEPAATGFRNDRPEAPAVAGTRHPLDEPIALHAIDESRDPALAEEDGRGELAHTQPVVGRVVEMQEDLVVRQRQIVRQLELAVELAHERGVDTEEPPPGAELERGQLLDIRCLHMQVFYT